MRRSQYGYGAVGNGEKKGPMSDPIYVLFLVGAIGLAFMVISDRAEKAPQRAGG
jgi:hypothetical protein